MSLSHGALLPEFPAARVHDGRGLSARLRWRGGWRYQVLGAEVLHGSAKRDRLRLHSRVHVEKNRPTHGLGNVPTDNYNAVPSHQRNRSVAEPLSERRTGAMVVYQHSGGAFDLSDLKHGHTTDKKCCLVVCRP